MRFKPLCKTVTVTEVFSPCIAFKPIYVCSPIEIKGHLLNLGLLLHKVLDATWNYVMYKLHSSRALRRNPPNKIPKTSSAKELLRRLTKPILIHRKQHKPPMMRE